VPVFQAKAGGEHKSGSFDDVAHGALPDEMRDATYAEMGNS
jgi:hypothetical protein